MKKILKNILQLFGLEIRRKRRVPESNALPIKYIPGKHRCTMEASLTYIKSLGYWPDTIIDIGAGSGTLPLLNVFPESRHLLFEPLQEFEPGLQKLKEIYNLEFRICALGKEDKKIQINVHKDLYGSSLLKEQDGAIADGVQREVEMISLQSLQNLFHLSDESTLLIKLDVQGAELEVLRSGEVLLQKADLVIMECSFFKFLLNSHDITEVIIYMKDQGFVIYEMFDFHNRPYDNALAQADIIFVKENGLFRKVNNWATAAQREAAIS